MTAHPNRKRSNRSLGMNPSAAEVKAARERAGFTPKQAGESIFKSFRSWQNWESTNPAEYRAMSASDFCLFLLITGQVTLEQVIAASEKARGAELVE